ncbi:MAG: hypothetical protein ACXWKO_07675 [Phenylobacterium sp.]
MSGGLTALVRTVLLWLLFIVLESAQGGLRRMLLAPRVQLAAREAGVLIGAALIFALTWLAWDRLKLRTARAALATGLLWAGLTLGFDFGLGRLLGASWADLARDYDPQQGGWMAAGLLAMALTPLLVRGMRRGRAA